MTSFKSGDRVVVVGEHILAGMIGEVSDINTPEKAWVKWDEPHHRVEDVEPVPREYLRLRTDVTPAAPPSPGLSVGDVVYLRGDARMEVAMTVMEVKIAADAWVGVCWLDSNKHMATHYGLARIFTTAGEIEAVRRREEDRIRDRMIDERKRMVRGEAKTGW